jgi:hypothetical protein
MAAPVEDAAIERVLATVNLMDTIGILVPGVDPAKLDQKTAAEIKWLRWAGGVGKTLSLLRAVMQRREAAPALVRLRKAVAHKQETPSVQALRASLKLLDPMSDDKLLERMLEDTQPPHVHRGALAPPGRAVILGLAWSNEQFVQYLLEQYRVIFGKQPKITRGGEAVKFIQTAMREAGIKYKVESIIGAMRSAKKPRRPHRQRK